jgi:two-component system repressor protein LuxO
MAFGRYAHAPVDVFIVDADASQRRALAGLIAERAEDRFHTRSFATSAEAMAARRDGASAIVIADLETIGGTARLPDFSGKELSLIATSNSGSLHVAVAAMKAGCVDFLPKPIGAKGLIERLEAALTGAGERPGPHDEAAAKQPKAFAGFIGNSPAMRAVYEEIRRMAPSRAAVFITGESGTGKEVSAEALHAHAGAPGRPFVAINCSAIPRDLMESEIFGHVRGAFTGAAENRPGAAELANGGTLFLDEIAEMDLGLQAKLLRFVQTGTVRRVGGSELKRVDVRIVSATNRDPFAEVAAGRFRSDLFYRLHVLPIHLKPLRERREDVLPLAEAFLERYAREEGRRFAAFSPLAVERLLACSWPGNVRQLQNVIRRIVVLHDGGEVSAAMLPDFLDGDGAPPASITKQPPRKPQVILPFWEQEREIIESALTAFAGNVGRAAAALDINPSTIYRKRQSWAERLRA